jgi:adenylate cyclase
MDHNADCIYRFGKFALDPVRGRLSADNGQELALRPKSFELLRLLVEHAGRLLHRDAINRVIWPDVVVTEDAVAQCISDIRRVICDLDQSMVRTLPRRGYMLTLPVRTVLRGQPDQGDGVMPFTDIPSIAVLPFANLSPDPNQQYFSDGIADDIITELSRSNLLLVIARNSSFGYRGRATDVRQISRELSVRYLLAGSVQREGARVRVNVQLVDAISGNHVWAERYDRELVDVFSIQEEITRAVAKAVLPAITAAELGKILSKRMESLGAWQAYQRGLWHAANSSKAENERAKTFFRLAVSKDPAFLPPYTALAMCCLDDGVSYGRRSLDEAFKAAREWTRKATSISPDDADTQSVIAWMTAGEGRYADAWDIATAALARHHNALMGDFAAGQVLLWNGEPAAASTRFAAVLRRNPRDPRGSAALAGTVIAHYLQEDYATAVSVARRAIARHPQFPQPYRWLAAALAQVGQLDQARRALDYAIKTAPEMIKMYVDSRPGWFRPEDHEHTLEGLRKAGLIIQPPKAGVTGL